MNQKQLLNISQASQRYGPKPSAFRKWILNRSLGNDAVVRCGRLVFLDSAVLDERIARTGQLLISRKEKSNSPRAGKSSRLGTQRKEVRNAQ
jgi:hypothetical protein